MKNFKDSGFRNGRKDFGGRPKFAGSQKNRDSDRNSRLGEKKELFSATCSKCQKSCEVPFRPSTDKPVYCSACFNKRDNETERHSNSDTRGETNHRQARTDFTKPQQQPESSAQNRELGDIKRQLITIEARLNRILDIINPPQASNKPVNVEQVEVLAVSKSEMSEPVKTKNKKAVTAKKVVKKATKKVTKKAVKKKSK